MTGPIRAFAALFLLFVLIFPTVGFSQDYGAWRRSESQSEMTDFMNLFFRVDAENTIPDLIGISVVRPTLWIRCVEDRTAILVNWRRYISTNILNNLHAVRYRIDDTQAVTTNWELSTNYESTGRWRGNGIPLLRQMRGATRFIIETTPHSSNTVRARFDITGFDTIAAEVAERCSWTF